jgi:hypothetical protein
MQQRNTAKRNIKRRRCFNGLGMSGIRANDQSLISRMSEIGAVDEFKEAIC